MARWVGIAALAVAWVACAALLLTIGGGGWLTRAVLVMGVLAAALSFLAPR